MESPTFIGLSRQTALRREMALTANNIANMNTTAFKAEAMIYATHKEKTLFQETLEFVVDRGSVEIQRPGSVITTGNPLDLHVDAENYFVVDNGRETKYTKNGNFLLDADRKLITANGETVLDDGGDPILIPPGESRHITVGTDGLISIAGAEVARLKVVTFDNILALKKSGSSLYTTTQAEREPERMQINQGSLEGSNVKPIIELTRMIDVQRAYEGVSKFLDSENERQRDMTRRLGQPNQT